MMRTDCEVKVDISRWKISMRFLEPAYHVSGSDRTTLVPGVFGQFSREGANHHVSLLGVQYHDKET